MDANARKNIYNEASEFERVNEIMIETISLGLKHGYTYFVYLIFT